MMYIVTRYNITVAGAEAHSQQKYDDETQAMKRYYNLLAADIDNPNLAYEMVQVVREDGIATASQVFDNRIQIEPGE